MTIAPPDIEMFVARLAYLAHAAGIYLILATQRPSLHVVTEIIRATPPSRIAFNVRSKVEGRIVVNAGGTKSLLGKGNMLF
jgi:S-DNA-T family DNA segregation ATPase FtsK/SpoIIIE